ncbi:MAG: hypothetical protein ABID71_01780 [Chloroflexota bacterium]
MTTKAEETAGIVAVETVAVENDGCAACQGETIFREDKKLGFYKLCVHCGHIEYLHRRFLRLDRESRHWE